MSETFPATSLITETGHGHSMYKRVRRQAVASPDAVAVMDHTGAACLTYATLVRRAGALAARLREDGVGQGEWVAVLLGHGEDTIVTMLAVLAAGAVYCPLDPDAPDQRTAAAVRALGARVAVTDDAGAARLPSCVAVVAPSTSGEPLAEAVEPSEDSLAYVLFTSGSTGTPKAVAMPHRGLSRLIGWQAANSEPRLRTLQFTAVSFDVVFQEVLSTLVTGGCLVVVPAELRRDPSSLLDVITSRAIERLFLPYVALQVLADAAVRRSVYPSSLRHVITAGERLVVTPAIRSFFTALRHCRLHNHYGPTEAHLVTSHTLTGDAARWPAAPPIGVPVDGVTCRVLDEDLDPVPDGEVGELYVAGTGLALGYLHDPCHTAARFVPDPVGGPGHRLYRTGDHVRAGEGGMLDFVGRTDGQLKVRGYRIEPAEVEQALTSHPQVAAAAVGLREVADDVRVLVAYAQTDGEVSSREITDHIRHLLPPYMIPAKCVTVDELPRTASGKVDGTALAKLALPDAPERPNPPSLDEHITAIWTRVLGHDEFEADDDFFDVGGDSLLATWVVTELSQTLGRTLELSLFLEYSTVDDLAVAIEAFATAPARTAPASQVVTLRPGPADRSVYLFHPLGGELIGYRELARASQAPVRLLGVGWSGRPPAFGSSLADIAAVHVEQLRTIQPDGPYLLAGWSFGGVLAYEVARQLAATGGAVDFLGLIDANPALDPITGLAVADTEFLTMLDSVAARLADPSMTGAELTELTSGQTWSQLMGAPIPEGASSRYLRTVVETARSCMNAAMHYQPMPYGGPVHLYQAAGSSAAHQERLAAALQPLCTGRLTVTAVPGDHWGLTRTECAGGIAARLDEALEQTGATGSGAHGSGR